MSEIYWTRFTNKAANHCLEGIIGPTGKKRVGKSKVKERKSEAPFKKHSITMIDIH